MLLGLIIILIFSNQYLLVNEEFFIILGFSCLCYLVKTNLGSIIENELSDRRNKILTSYLEYLKKKIKLYNRDLIMIKKKTNYLYNYTFIQEHYFIKFIEMFQCIKAKKLLDNKKSIESSFIVYFAGLVSKKRKFL